MLHILFAALQTKCHRTWTTTLLSPSSWGLRAREWERERCKVAYTCSLLLSKQSTNYLTNYIICHGPFDFSSPRSCSLDKAMLSSRRLSVSYTALHPDILAFSATPHVNVTSCRWYYDHHTILTSYLSNVQVDKQAWGCIWPMSNPLNILIHFKNIFDPVFHFTATL